MRIGKATFGLAAAAALGFAGSAQGTSTTLEGSAVHGMRLAFEGAETGAGSEAKVRDILQAGSGGSLGAEDRDIEGGGENHHDGENHDFGDNHDCGDNHEDNDEHRVVPEPGSLVLLGGGLMGLLSFGRKRNR